MTQVKFNCQSCKQDFYDRYRGTYIRKFCSQTCSKKSQDRTGPKRQGQYIDCRMCRKSIYRHPSTLNRQCCSKKCANKYIQQLYKADEERKAHAARLHKLIKNRSSGEVASQRVKQLFRDGKLKKRLGSTNNFWKGGKSSPEQLARQRSEYKDWRKAVLARDNSTCQECSSTEDLHVHHIKAFSKYLELRTDVDNGMTLCRDCHGKAHGRPLPDIARANLAKV